MPHFNLERQRINEWCAYSECIDKTGRGDLVSPRPGRIGTAFNSAESNAFQNL